MNILATVGDQALADMVAPLWFIGLAIAFNGVAYFVDIVTRPR